MDTSRREIKVFRQREENMVALKREMALKSINIRKLGIENLEQVLHIQLFKQLKKYATDSGNLEGEKNEVRRDRV